METRIVRLFDHTGTCDMCGVTGMLYDVEDFVGDSLIDAPVCASCAEIAQEMVLLEVLEEERLSKILEECKYVY